MDVEVNDFGSAHGSGYCSCEEFRVDIKYLARRANAKGGSEYNIIRLVNLSDSFDFHLSRESCTVLSIMRSINI